jgi:predicted NBD/HSP70 family sugar kinase
MTLRIGLDIGGTKTAAIIIDEAGSALGRLTRPTNVDSPRNLVDGTVAIIHEAIRATGIGADGLLSVGVGIPGLVDPANGTVSMAVNLNLREPYPLRDALQQALGAPVALENDVRAAALGAYHWARAVEPLRNVAYLSIGTGISAGIVLDGHLYRGARGMAGEIGHVPLDSHGPRCVCGAYGCLEVYAAGPAIAAQAASVIQTPDGRTPTTNEVYALAAAGHAAAGQVVERAAGYLSRAVYLLLMAYDVEKVVIGGGVTRAGDAFEQPLRRAMDALRANSALTASMMPNDKVVIIPADYHAGVMGAVYLTPPAPQHGKEVH